MGILEQISLFEGKEEYKIFVDMDGVLTDFEKAFENFGEKHTKGFKPFEYEKEFGQKALWGLIEKKGKLDFWENMPWMDNGKELWNYVKKYNPTILTSPTDSDDSKKGKKIWIERELGENVPYILEKDKYKHADTNYILIDDYDKKINDWIEKGDGIGIYHKNTEDTIKQLKEYGL